MTNQIVYLTHVSQIQSMLGDAKATLAGVLLVANHKIEIATRVIANAIAPIISFLLENNDLARSEDFDIC
jgi:hypothetical protein